MNALRLLPVCALAALGFATATGCFLGPGTREPRTAPPPPTAGPRWERGGERVRAPVAADAAARARAALVAQGWTVVPSRRDDEALGVIHDNLAVLRWSRDGWWARVEQHSTFEPPHEQVPTWDHPWAALRLLHQVVPDAGPAEGRVAPPPMPPALLGDAAEAAYRTALIGLLTDQPLDHGRALALREHLAPPDDARLRARLAVVARGTVDRPMKPLGAGRYRSVRTVTVVTVVREAVQRVLGGGERDRSDPYVALPTTYRFGPALDRTDGARPSFMHSGELSSGDEAEVSDRMILGLMDAYLVGADTVPWMTGAETQRLARLRPPGVDLLSGGTARRWGDLGGWWRDHGRAWIAAGAP